MFMNGCCTWHFCNFLDKTIKANSLTAKGKCLLCFHVILSALFQIASGSL
jgi:hypothetical protein